MPSAYFHSYTGTLPEPPCSPDVDWRVMDIPMSISQYQLSRIRSLLTDPNEGACGDDPYNIGHGEGNVDGRARPVRGGMGRPYWYCERNDFPLDCERDNGWCNCDAILCPDDLYGLRYRSEERRPYK